MVFTYEKSKSTKEYNSNLDLAQLNISVKNISHSTLKLPKREIEHIRWLFSGDLRENER